VVRQPKPKASQPTAVADSNWQLQLALMVGLVLAVLAVYSQAGHFFFITFDDPLYVSENFRVRAGLSLENIKWVFSTVVDANWVPLTLLSHMAVCEWFGMQSGMHHWANVVLHALSSVLLFAWLRRATHALWPSAFVAFVFALHPLHVESVAWISERKDVLSTFFWFLGLYAYVRYAERPSPRRYALVMALFCLGLLSKPMLVTFPFTLLLLDVWPLRRMQFPRTLIEKLPFFALSIVSAIVTYFAQRSGGAVQASPVGERVQNALLSYVGYIGQMFWPVDLAFFYPHRTSIAVWQVAGALVILLGISAAAVWTWRTRPYFAAGWFWYLGTLVPVIGLVQVGVQSHADRYMYIPMVGLSVVVAWGAAELLKKWPQLKLSAAAAAGVACLTCLVTASAQAQYWLDSGTLYRRAISVTNDNYVAQYNLGDYLVDVPNHASECVAHFDEALRIRPDAAPAHNGLGGYLLQTGHEAEAIAHFEAALRTEPNLAAAHFNLGLAFSKHPDRLLDAVAHYQAALRSNPQIPNAEKNLGIVLLRLGRRPEAITHFVAAQRLRDDPEVNDILNALRAEQK
jgi:tetratricopeptide (TPR) repeat protein